MEVRSCHEVSIVLSVISNVHSSQSTQLLLTVTVTECTHDWAISLHNKTPVDVIYINMKKTVVYTHVNGERYIKNSKNRKVDTIYHHIA